MSLVQFLISNQKTDTKEKQLETIEMAANEYYTVIEENKIKVQELCII